MVRHTRTVSNIHIHYIHKAPAVPPPPAPAKPMFQPTAAAVPSAAAVPDRWSDNAHVEQEEAEDMAALIELGCGDGSASTDPGPIFPDSCMYVCIYRVRMSVFSVLR